MALAIPVIASAAQTHLDYCFSDAAKRTGMNRDILIAIAINESGLNGATVHKNDNGSEDIGVMQINSIHFPFLKSVGIKRNDLFNMCVNIHVGALILKECVRIHGNTWAAVGAYNVGHKRGAKEDEKRRKYAFRIWKKYNQLKKD